MKHIFFVITILAALCFVNKVNAQRDTLQSEERATAAKISFGSTSRAQKKDTLQHKGKGTTINLGPRGFKLTHDNKWTHTNPSWAAKGSYYAMKRIDSNDYVYTINNLRGFYGVGKDTVIERIAIIFKDSLGNIQTSNLTIPVTRPGTLSRNAHIASNNYESSITTIPSLVIDSTESVTIHFHPYLNKRTGKAGDESLRTFSGTMFIYTGIISNPPNDKYRDDKDKGEGDFETHWGILDIGVNMIADNTNYNSAAAKNFLNVPANQRNSSLFNLRQGKSINVNIYPWMQTLYAVKRKNQKINISTGLGLQLYNFRYDNSLTYTKSPNSVTLDTLSFKKDKLAFDYINIPLMVTFKTRIHNNKWLVYGVGITGGYSLSTWTKQISINDGKVKVHDAFGFSNFNSCLTGEIGIYPGIRFYGTYQLTNMFNASTGMNQHPISIGIRFFAI